MYQLLDTCYTDRGRVFQTTAQHIRNSADPSWVSSVAARSRNCWRTEAVHENWLMLSEWQCMRDVDTNVAVDSLCAATLLPSLRTLCLARVCMITQKIYGRINFNGNLECVGLGTRNNQYWILDDVDSDPRLFHSDEISGTGCRLHCVSPTRQSASSRNCWRLICLAETAAH